MFTLLTQIRPVFENPNSGKGGGGGYITQLFELRFSFSIFHFFDQKNTDITLLISNFKVKVSKDSVEEISFICIIW